MAASVIPQQESINAAVIQRPKWLRWMDAVSSFIVMSLKREVQYGSAVVSGRPPSLKEL